MTSPATVTSAPSGRPGTSWLVVTSLGRCSLMYAMRWLSGWTPIVRYSPSMVSQPVIVGSRAMSCSTGNGSAFWSPIGR